MNYANRIISIVLVVALLCGSFCLSALADGLEGTSWSYSNSTVTTGFGSSWSTYTVAVPIYLSSTSGFGNISPVLTNGQATAATVCGSFSPTASYMYPMNGYTVNVNVHFAVDGNADLSTSNFGGASMVTVVPYDASGSPNTNSAVSQTITPTYTSGNAHYHYHNTLSVSDGISYLVAFIYVKAYGTALTVGLGSGTSVAAYSSGSGGSSGDTIVNVDTSGIEALLSEISSKIDPNNTEAIAKLEQIRIVTSGLGNILLQRIVPPLTDIANKLTVLNASIETVVDHLADIALNIENNFQSGGNYDDTAILEYLENQVNMLGYLDEKLETIANNTDSSNAYLNEIVQKLIKMDSSLDSVLNWMQGLYNFMASMTPDIEEIREYASNLADIYTEMLEINSKLDGETASLISEIVSLLTSQGTDISAIKDFLSNISGNTDTMKEDLSDLLNELRNASLKVDDTNSKLDEIIDLIEDFEVNVENQIDKIYGKDDSNFFKWLAEKIISAVSSLIDFASDLGGDVFTSVPTMISGWNNAVAFWDAGQTFDYKPYQIITYTSQSSTYPNSNNAVQTLFDEAEKYLGYPYVWGGSSPETSFDCSGYVSYCLNASGVYATGRLTAQGLYDICTPIDWFDAQPGDLIFFTGTYDCPDPVSHVGFYAGNGQMLHCGDPIQYTSCKTSYWNSHLYAYGRLPYNAPEPGWASEHAYIYELPGNSLESLTWRYEPSDSVEAIELYEGIPTGEYWCYNFAPIYSSDSDVITFSPTDYITETQAADYLVYPGWPAIIGCVAYLSDGSIDVSRPLVFTDDRYDTNDEKEYAYDEFDNYTSIWEDWAYANLQ